jgi:glycosyltransferase involved in cell wall biosynthesis
MRRWYRARLQLIRRADRILAISQTTARDVLNLIGGRDEQVVTVGAAVSERFRPPSSREEAFAAATAAVSELDPGFVLYTGGIEPRKNLDRLLAAYAALPAEVRNRHGLVVVCRVSAAERQALARQVADLGVAGRVLFPGYVDEEALVHLYQSCALFVFPSLYEGFGFPIAEAIACGAPVIASRTPAATELVHDEEALFDPLEVEAISASMENGLLDEALRERLMRRPVTRLTWSDVAQRTLAVYDELLRLPPRARPRSAG